MGSGIYDKAIECINISLNSINNLTTDNESKLMYILLDDYCNHSNAKIDIESVLSHLLKENPSLELSDAYHTLAGSQIKKKLYLESIKTLQQELQVRQKFAPGSYNGLLANLVPVYMRLLSAKPTDFDAAINNCMELNGIDSTISLLFMLHSKLVSGNKYTEAVSIIQTILKFCNEIKPANTAYKNKALHLLLTDYIVELDNNIGPNPILSIQSILNSFGKDEDSIDLADGYNRYGVYCKSKGDYVEAIKSFQQELKIRMHLEPRYYNNIYSNIVSTYLEMINASGTSLSNNMDDSISNFEEINGAQDTIKLLIDIYTKLYNKQAYEQASFCLNLALNIYNESNMNNAELKYLIYHGFINLNNIFMTMDLNKGHLDTPTFSNLDSYIKEITKEQAIVELSNTALTVLNNLYPIKGIELLLNAAIICADLNKPQSAYFSLFESIYKIVRAHPEFVQGVHEDSFENVFDYEKTFGKFFKYADKAHIINNTQPGKHYPLTIIEMYHYVAGKYLNLNDYYNADLCIRAASFITDFNIPKHDQVLKSINLAEFNLRKSLNYKLNKLGEVISMLKHKSCHEKGAVVGIKDQECISELVHIAEMCLKDKLNHDFNDGIRAYLEALHLCKRAHPGNNYTTAGLLHDIALAYHEQFVFTHNKEFENEAKEFEGKYERMMQCIQQGIS